MDKAEVKSKALSTLVITAKLLGNAAELQIQLTGLLTTKAQTDKMKEVSSESLKVAKALIELTELVQQL